VGGQIKKNEMSGACSAWGSSAYRVMMGKPEGNTPLGRPKLTWEFNIKIALIEIVQEGVNWIDLAQDKDKWHAVVNTAMKLWMT
jgi:hypothetical protein